MRGEKTLPPDVGKDSPFRLDCELGYWTAGGIRNTPRGVLEWNGIARRSYAASAGGKPVATVRRWPADPKTWVASIPGFIWNVGGDRGSTTQAALKITESPTRGFRTSAAARAAVGSAYAALIAHLAQLASQDSSTE